MVRAPTENEAVICPSSGTQKRVAPEKVYDVTENGKRVTRGIIAPHRHWWQSAKDGCDWVGHPVPVVPKNTGPRD